MLLVQNSDDEQQSIRARYVDDNLNAFKDLLGFYEVQSSVICQLVEDADIAIMLKGPRRLKGFDRSANMAGNVRFVQVIFREKQPMDPFCPLQISLCKTRR